MQQRTIGLLGGIGWASTALYYRLINERVVARLDGSHSARIVLVSMDQFDFVSRASRPDACEIHDFLIAQARRLESAGADFFLVCANGAHRFIADVVPHVGIPFVSIVDETAKHVHASGIRKVGLLGVKQTMSGTFYHDRLRAYGVDVVTPGAADQARIHDIIYSELVQNRVTQESRDFFLEIIRALIAEGSRGVILGCTELPLILGQGDVDVPVFDSAEIHCQAAVVFAFDGPLP